MNRPFWPLTRLLLLLLGGAAGGATAPPMSPAHPAPTGQSPQQFSTTVQRTVSLRYLRYVPATYDPKGTKRWPLLLFLHGAGERGNDLNLVTRHGPPKRVLHRPDFPFVVISPQCPSGEVWDVETLDALLTDILEREAVDPRRVYLTGLSMGGFGTWAWASARPDRFAAILPICGGGDPIRVWLADSPRRDALRRLPIWAFHGALDAVVPPAESERMLDAFRRVGNEPRLTVYPDAGHDSWTATYENPAIYDWLLAHPRP